MRIDSIVALIRTKFSINKSLKLEIIVVTSFCFLISGAYFLFADIAIRPLLLGEYHERVVHPKLFELKEDFQEYVMENKISHSEFEKIDEWASENEELLIVNVIKFEEAKTRKRTTNDHGKRRGSQILALSAVIDYSDGSAKTTFRYAPSISVKIMLRSANLLLSFAIFLAVFYCFLKMKLDYISKIDEGLSILEGGDLSYVIPVEGTDELGRLAMSANQMGRSIENKIRSEQKALQSNKEIIGDLSHDIRTPLTVIIGYLTMLAEEQQLTDRQKETYLQLALKKADQMKNRIGELLDFATIYSGQQIVNKTIMDARIILEQLQEELAGLAEMEAEDNIEEGIMIYADSKLLERLLDNILSNIQKYGDLEKNVVLNCSVSGGMVKISIKNHISSEARTDGKSLGLKISAYIMGIHGGYLDTNEGDGVYETVITIPFFEKE